jgi:hypothetical protein
MQKNNVSIFFAIIIIVSKASAQETGQLFGTENPLPIALTFSIREVAKTKKDSVYLPHLMYYKTQGGMKDSIKLSLKSRGNYRLQECYFPPLWIKFDKKAIKGTLFQGNKKLKLVLPCKQGTINNSLIIKEYLCYKLYEVISPYAFKARLVNIDFTEIRNKRSRHYDLKGILVEDLETTARRLNGKAREDLKLSYMSMQDTGALRFSLFQFMISNTDLSMAYQHNTKLLQTNNGSYVSVPYDFDMSGLVDAPYAVVSQVNGVQLDAQSVRDRVYRGWCRAPAVTEYVRNEFLLKQEKILSAVDDIAGELDEKEIREIKAFLEKFFDIIKSDFLFKTNITDLCRKPE